MNRVFVFLALTAALFFQPLAQTQEKINEIDITHDFLKETDEKIRQLCNDVTPAVVTLIPARRGMGTGSGVIVSKDGLILTAAHVATEMNEEVTVIFPDGNRAAAKVLGMDFSRDAAMMQIVGDKKKNDFPFVEVGESADMVRNEFTIALGHPGGYQADRSPPVRLGRVISNVGKQERFLVTDSALIGGDSGGPLFDLEGKLIGIHSNIGYYLSQNRHVPITVFLEAWDRMKKGERYGGKHEGGFLENPDLAVTGAGFKETKEKKGAEVARLLNNGPAKKAGLKVGDVVLKVDDVEVTTVRSLLDHIEAKKPGDRVIMIVRSAPDDKTNDGGGTERGLSIKLASAKDFPSPRNRGPRRPPQRPEPPQKEKPEPKKTDKEKETPKADAPKKDDIENEPNPLDKESKSDPKTSKEIDSKVQEKFNSLLKSKMDEGHIELSPEEIEEFGGAFQIGRLMRAFRNGLSAEDKNRLAQGPPSPTDYDPEAIPIFGEKFFRDVLNAFHPSTEKASKATHLVFRGTEWKAFCTMIDETGFALTKASDINTENNQKLTVLVKKGKAVPATVIKTFEEHDLALIKLRNRNEKKYETVSFHPTTAETHPNGAIISSVGSSVDPVAIGVVSVQARTLAGRDKGFLGIGTGEHEKGVRVTGVMDGASAQKAGVKPGDVITKVDGVVTDTPEKLIKAVSGKPPGTKIRLHYIRKDETGTREVKLGSREEIEMGRPDPNGRMNRFGTKVSRRSTGFKNALQTDMPIEPQQCGGPVVDLEGNVIGINISRAGRVKTYILPAADIQKLLDDEITELIKNTPPEKKKEKKKEPAAANEQG